MLAELVDLDARRRRRRVESLRQLAPPELGGELVEKCAQLLDAHPQHRGCFIIAGRTYGPFLAPVAHVGPLVLAAAEPCVVIDLDLLSPVPVEPFRFNTRGDKR